MDEMDKIVAEVRQLVEDFKNCHLTEQRLNIKLEVALSRAYLAGKLAAQEELS